MKEIARIARRLKALQGRSDEVSQHERWQLSRDWDALQKRVLAAKKGSTS